MSRQHNSKSGSFATFQDAFVSTICSIYSSPDVICSSRNGDMREKLSISFTVEDPSSYKFADNHGRLSYDYAAHFYDWMLHGSSPEATEKFLAKYPNVKNFLVKPVDSNLPANFNSFYGERILRQLPAVLIELKSKENSRRAVINILNEGDQILFDAVENDMTEYPCCDGVTLNIRNGKLYQHVHMRSNNMGQVAKLDMYLWGRFQCEIAEKLEVEVGTCSWSIVSAHIFDKDINYFFTSGIFNDSTEALATYIKETSDMLAERHISITGIRHSATVANETRLLQGVTNTSLSESGKNVIKVDAFNALDDADIVYCSQLQRTVDTLDKYIANQNKDFFKFCVKRDELLNEMSWGHLDGVATVTEDFQKYVHEMSTRGDEKYYSDAETYNSLLQRLSIFLTKMLMHDIGTKVVVVSHGLPLGALNSCVNGKSAFDYAFKPGHDECIYIGFNAK